MKVRMTYTLKPDHGEYNHVPSRVVKLITLDLEVGAAIIIG